MKYWLHRISHEGECSRRLLESGKLTIGFSDLSTQDFLDKANSARSVDDLNSDVKGVYKQLLRSRHSLWRFLKEMHVGDLVIVPHPGTYSVYAIKGEPRLLENVGFDLGFYRDVEIYKTGDKEAKNISRYDYADRALTARMKVRNTNVEISDLSTNINSALDAYGHGKPITLRSRTAALAEELLGLIYCQLTPRKFESLLQWYFQRIGASVDIPAKTHGKGGDADITASFDSLRLTIHVQAKHHDPDKTTGNWPVQQVRDYARDYVEGKEREATDDDVHALWVVSTSKKFTETCMNEAREHGVVLINGIQFAHMLLDAGLESLDI